MLDRFRQAGLIWPTVFAIVAFATLVSLGTWQWQRLAWKEDLLQRLQHGARAVPVDLHTLAPFNDPNAIRFRRVRVSGRFDHDREFHVWSPGEAGSAWRIVTPLLLMRAGEEARTGASQVLVIRGTVSDAHKAAASRPSGQLEGHTTFVGRIRLSAVNWATPKPELATNQWYGLDLDAMRRALIGHGPANADQSTAIVVAPFFVEAENTVGPSPAPQPALKQLTLRNRHFEYALTWWGLSLTLVGVFAAFAAGRFRQT
ncbi:MAG: SURF1 family protein [Hyphomicrobiaceae bacterium]